MAPVATANPDSMDRTGRMEATETSITEPGLAQARVYLLKNRSRSGRTYKPLLEPRGKGATRVPTTKEDMSKAKVVVGERL